MGAIVVGWRLQLVGEPAVPFPFTESLAGLNISRLFSGCKIFHVSSAEEIDVRFDADR
jgi:hypothetical protein